MPPKELASSTSIIKDAINKIDKKAPEKEIHKRLNFIFFEYVFRERVGKGRNQKFLIFIDAIVEKFGNKPLNYSYSLGKNERTLLYYAIEYANAEVVKKLIQHGCDPSKNLRQKGMEHLSHIELGLMRTQRGDVAGLMRFYGEKANLPPAKKKALDDRIDDYKRKPGVADVKLMEKTYKELKQEEGRELKAKQHASYAASASACFEASESKLNSEEPRGEESYLLEPACDESTPFLQQAQAATTLRKRLFNKVKDSGNHPS